MRWRGLLAGLAVVGFVTLLPATSASAHPLGNFTVNQHSGLVVGAGRITVELVVDMAEIPTFQARSDIDTDGDRTVSPGEASAYRQRACAEQVQGVELRFDDEPLTATVASSDLTFPPGEAGLATLRLTCRVSASAPRHPGGLDFANHNFTNRVGWREITAVGDGARLAASDVPARSGSAVLTDYPDDLLSSPLDQRQAHVRLGAAAGPAGFQAAARTTPPGRPRHARAPPRPAAPTGSAPPSPASLPASSSPSGSGCWPSSPRSPSAPSMPSRRVTARPSWPPTSSENAGSLRQAALLGLTVTSTHTAGVLVLGVLLSGSTAVVPEELYPWLGMTSGAMLAAVGVSLLARAWRRRSGGLAAFAAHRHGEHDHGPGHHHQGRHHHHHSTHHHDAEESVAPHAHDVQPPMSRRALMIMGAAGGMVPSPSALVVLLGAIALGRTWFGVALVLGYGIGMALTLVAAGLLMVHARASLDRRLRGRTPMARLAQALPVMTASFVVIAGVGLAARALHQM